PPGAQVPMSGFGPNMAYPVLPSGRLVTRSQLRGVKSAGVTGSSVATQLRCRRTPDSHASWKTFTWVKPRPQPGARFLARSGWQLQNVGVVRSSTAAIILLTSAQSPAVII